VLDLERHANTNDERKWAKKSQSSASIKAMLTETAARPEIIANLNSFDQKHFYLNLANGTFDLESGVLRPHSREDMLTSLVDIHYHTEAKGPKWDAFLTEVFAGNQILIEYLK
jgi:putative DNA primase/helicase